MAIAVRYNFSHIIFGQRPPVILAGGLWPGQIPTPRDGSGDVSLALSGELGSVDSPAVLGHNPIGGLGRAFIDLDD